MSEIKNGEKNILVVQEFGAPLDIISMGEEKSMEKIREKIAGAESPGVSVEPVKAIVSISSENKVEQLLSQILAVFSNTRAMLSLTLLIAGMYLIYLLISLNHDMHKLHKAFDFDLEKMRNHGLSWENYVKLLRDLNFSEHSIKLLYLWQVKMRK